jgi:GTP pyrophosphokinase
MDIEDFISKLNQFKNINSSDWELIINAFNFAQKAHSGQKRKSGEPYFEHCLRTALILAELKLDALTISAGLLHDVLEDTETTEKELNHCFDWEICFLVKAVSRVGQIKYREKNLAEAENLRKLILVFAEDIRAALIKLADRLDNIRTLNYLTEPKRKRIAMETMDIYAPLGRRLGLAELAKELEDLSFKYAQPKEYIWLVKNLQEKYEARRKYLDEIKPLITEALMKNRLKIIKLEYRLKGYLSVFRKLKKCDFDLDKIYDLLAFRIITEKVEDCYAVLGIIHSIWLPLEEEINDYIILPKPNGYRSLHTTVALPNNHFVEFQIRTAEMHEHNEFGVASHMAYSEAKESKNYLKRKNVFAKKTDLLWLQQLREWQKEFANSEEYFESLKINFFEEKIFVITPKGKVIELPEESTPVDFAYKIHSDIGDHCIGARVNGKIVPLNSCLNSGDVVEIITSKNKKPSSDWLDFVRTHNAKRSIRAFLKNDFV